MRFNVRVLCVSVMCFGVWGCGGEETPVDKDPVCADGEVVNPVTGMCMTQGMDMSQAMDMSRSQDMPQGVEDMGRDMTAADAAMDMTVADMMQPVDMSMSADMASDMVVVDMASGQFGVLVGKITRTAMPKNGGVGPVFVAMFEKNPITSSTSGADPGLVAFQRIENVDFTDPATAVLFRLEAIPPRPEPYFITAFLDDNMSANTAMPESAGPDRDDLVSLDGIGSPKVTINAPGESTLDLVLNFAMIF